jgi:hypothetical protein
VNRNEFAGERMSRAPMRALLIARKAILERAIILYAKFLPDMIREPPDEPNTIRFFEARDEFLKHIANDSKKSVLESILKIALSERKHDPDWTQWGDWFIDELNRRGWRPLPKGKPDKIYWKE